MSKRNLLVLGICTGALLPVLSSELLRITLPDWNYLTYDMLKIANWKPYLPILQVGLFFNVGPLLFFNYKKWDEAIKGLIIGTLLVGILFFSIWIR